MNFNCEQYICIDDGISSKTLNLFFFKLNINFASTLHSLFLVQFDQIEERPAQLPDLITAPVQQEIRERERRRGRLRTGNLRKVRLQQEVLADLGDTARIPPKIGCVCVRVCACVCVKHWTVDGVAVAEV